MKKLFIALLFLTLPNLVLAACLETATISCTPIMDEWDGSCRTVQCGDRIVKACDNGDGTIDLYQQAGSTPMVCFNDACLSEGWGYQNQPITCDSTPQEPTEEPVACWGDVVGQHIRISSPEATNQMLEEAYLDEGEFHLWNDFSQEYLTVSLGQILYRDVANGHYTEITPQNIYTYSENTIGSQLHASGMVESTSHWLRPYSQPENKLGMMYTSNSGALCWGDGTTWHKVVGGGVCD